MTPKTTLKTNDDISVVVPDSLNLITTYVLREQGDWFEDEIRFVRLLLKPHQMAIDIGANYGLYAMSMAKVVGPEGKIWAFEPASSTADFLAESVDINGFSQITLDRRAVSERMGTAQLSLNENSELNELVRDGVAKGAVESVALTTLDDAMAQYGWSDIGFVKIDAEGEEAAIIRGGRRFFQRLSPLVQYEVKAGNSVHLDLVEAFEEIGYSSYRLVPGLGILLPFDPVEPIDPYLLNLFCCKPDRAGMIAADNRLIQVADTVRDKTATRANELLRRRNAGLVYSWQNVLSQLPYGRQLAPIWQQTVGHARSIDIEDALALHAISRDANLPLPERALALRASLDLLNAACRTRPGFLRYATQARVAREYGARAIAVTALEKLVNDAMMHGRVNPTEPFLATSERYETIDPKEAIGNWVVCSALEELERTSRFSSFYSDPSIRQRLEVIENLGFGSPEMARRLTLLEQRFFGGAGLI